MGDFFKERKNLVLAGIAVLVFGVLMLSSMRGNNQESSKTQMLQSKYQSLSTNIDVINKKLDERIVKLEQRMQKQANNQNEMQTTINSLQQNQGKISQMLTNIQDSIKRLNDRITELKAQKTQIKNPFKKPEVRITAINITNPNQQTGVKKNKSKKVVKEYLKLPDASIVRGTVVSGIYAPVTSTEWLPTLINVDEAFYGPNDTRVPLKNCKVLAEAQGDYTTQRASVKIYKLSCVLPNGQARSFKIKGYVADNKDSAFGIHGHLISVTGKYIAGSFLTSFLSGYSSALSQAETSNTVTSTGATVSSVTGSTTRYAGFSGVSSAFGNLASYYQSKLNKLIDMIYIPSGRKVWLVIQKGVVIKGYLPTINENTFGGVD